MAFFGFSSKKEVEEKERLAREQGKQNVLNNQQRDLSNIGKGSQVKFSVPDFDVFDPRYENFAVPVSVQGMVVYAVDDFARFNSINKTENFNDAVFQEKLRGQVTKYVKDVVANAPDDNNIPVLKLERKIVEICELVQKLVTPKIEQLFGVTVRSIDITEIHVNKDSEGYIELKSVTADLERESIQTQHKVNLSNFTFRNDLDQDAMRRRHEMQLSREEGLQDIDMEDYRESKRIAREENQREARLETESRFLSAHQANLNAGVGMARAQSGGMFGQRATSSPQMPGTCVPPMPGMDVPAIPTAVPQVSYIVGVNGQQVGPCDWNQLKELVQQGQLTQQTYVWTQGMAQWDLAGNIGELQPLFNF